MMRKEIRILRDRQASKELRRRAAVCLGTQIGYIAAAACMLIIAIVSLLLALAML